jgi:hypothetical protein
MTFTGENRHEIRGTSDRHRLYSRRAVGCLRDGCTSSPGDAAAQACTPFLQAHVAALDCGGKRHIFAKETGNLPELLRSALSAASAGCVGRFPDHRFRPSLLGAGQCHQNTGWGYWFPCVPVFQRYDIFHPWPRRYFPGYNNCEVARRARSGDGVRVPSARYQLSPRAQPVLFPA